MLLTLIRRELLDNLMTFRFAAAMFITLLLVVANTAVLIKDYERRLASYNTALNTHRQQLRETKTYSAGEIVVDRPPNPLSIFNVGLDKRLGNEIEVSYTISKSKCYSRSETRNELRYYKPAFLVTHGSRISITPSCPHSGMPG